VQNVEKDIEREIVDMLFQNVRVVSPLDETKGRRYGGARYYGTKTKEGREVRGEMPLPIPTCPVCCTGSHFTCILLA
jgi:hypothetical protein